MAWGDAAPGYRDNPIFGLVQTRTDKSIREKAGGPEWLAAAATRPIPRLCVPEAAPVDPYLSRELPI